MGAIPQSFWNYGVKDGNPLAMEPEGGGDLASLNYTKMGWGCVACAPTPPRLPLLSMVARVIHPLLTTT